MPLSRFIQKDLEAQVAQAEANLKAADAGVGVSKASFWPAVSAETDYGVKGTTYFPQKGDNFAGLKVTMPLFNGQDLYTRDCCEMRFYCHSPTCSGNPETFYRRVLLAHGLSGQAGQ